ncbi:MAG: hypothetical protein ABF629_08245 [Sporolactobacillus sp.]|uniref:hypothetical protein n=1 Tax=Sporolactobacillus sp. STSJ-5 TaxID=2965076 RepID=UPI00210589D2|nr:hypothetical protein [Sporolactobacillus sp. STSJ-5]MCQ2008398.1 hypothetical protein [Sporolactobacillus sp. STSJ-5]
MNTDHNWSSLDNAALIFPAAAQKADTQVFRISCELYEQIDPVSLQSALDETIQIFRVYQSVLKRGFFWYYLENTNRKPVVHEENTQPCAALYRKNSKNLLFDVSYFKNRINLEVYHVLSDGTGAMHFLRTLITKYLSQYHQIDEPSLDFDASATQMSDDSFRKYYRGSSRKKQTRRVFACRLRGHKYPEDRLKIMTGLIKIQPLLDAAHRHHTTLTVFLAACLMNAISETVPERAKKRPIVLDIPVNLRSHFPSASARNFFSVLLIGYDYWHHDGTFEDVVKKISDDLRVGLSKEKLSQVIETYSAVEHNIFARITPLIVKDPALKVAYHYAARRKTAGFSNLGIVSMPKELEAFIRSFDICYGSNQLQVCMCSFQDRLSISFSSPFVSSEIQRRFFRTLTSMGAEVEITTSPTGNMKEGES